MNIRSTNTPLPDFTSITPELTFDDVWNTEAIAELIRSRSDNGETPSFLFLGRKEAALLSEHLEKVFGEDAVVTLHDTYYMGLEVVVLDCESFVNTGGRKTSRTLQDPISRRPAWRDRETEALWQFRV